MLLAWFSIFNIFLVGVPRPLHSLDRLVVKLHFGRRRSRVRYLVLTGQLKLVTLFPCTQLYDRVTLCSVPFLHLNTSGSGFGLSSLRCNTARNQPLVKMYELSRSLENMKGNACSGVCTIVLFVQWAKCVFLELCAFSCTQTAVFAFCFYNFISGVRRLIQNVGFFTILEINIA